MKFRKTYIAFCVIVIAVNNYRWYKRIMKEVS